MKLTENLNMNTKVDHRCGHRIPVKTTVELYQRGEHVGSATVRNIALNGIFIEKSSATFNKHNMLEVEFKTNTDNNTKHNRVLAMVVYCADGGYGLDLDLETAFPEARLALLLLMNKAKRQQALSLNGNIAA